MKTGVAVASKRYARKQGKRQPREAIAIYTEGTVTEVEYLKYVRHKLGIPKELVQIHHSDHSDPKGLIDDAVAAKKKNRRDAVRGGSGLIESWWVLADIECGRPGLHEAVRKAKDNDIWLGLCDPSIEFWLMLHFRYTTRSFGNVKELIRQLKEHLPDYSEENKHPDMQVLFPRLSDAMDNSSKLRKNHTSIGCGSPRTDCDLLIAELNCQASRGKELFSREKPSNKSLSIYNCGFD